jgi:hypothetical protein
MITLPPFLIHSYSLPHFVALAGALHDLSTHGTLNHSRNIKSTFKIGLHLFSLRYNFDSRLIMIPKGKLLCAHVRACHCLGVKTFVEGICFTLKIPFPSLKWKWNSFPYLLSIYGHESGRLYYYGHRISIGDIAT